MSNEITLEPRVIKVIALLKRRGRGVDETDPVRLVTQIYTLDGELLAESDPLARPPAFQPLFVPQEGA